MSNQDTLTPDDFLDSEDNKYIASLVEIKRHIYSYIDKAALLRFIISLIETDGIITFAREDDKDFIEFHNMSFDLVLNASKLKKTYPKIFQSANAINGSDGYEETIEARKEVVRNLVIIPYSEMMSNLLGMVLGHTPVADYPYLSIIQSILPKNYLELSKHSTAFKDVSENKEEAVEDFKFLFSVISSIRFAPEDTNLDEDTTFLLEIML